jgi:effector-binding domain-containing protein
MSYEIRLLDLPDQPTLGMRAIMPVEKLPEFFGKAYGGVIAYLAELGDTPSGMPFAAYCNLDMNALDIEAGFPVAKILEGKGEIKAGIISAGKYVSTLHQGSYESVKIAYAALILWVKENGYEPSGISYEYYLNDPSSDPSIIPETEVRVQLK